MLKCKKDFSQKNSRPALLTGTLVSLLFGAIVLIGMKYELKQNMGNFPGSGIRNKQVSDIESGYPDIESGYPDIRI